MANQSWNEWKFQTYWNKFEWVNPRSRIEGNNPFFLPSKKFCYKDNDKNSYWVGHSKLRPLDLEDFLKEKIINKIEASLTWVSIEKSNSGMKNNPDLLEVTKVVNSDADLATYERKNQRRQ